MTNKKTLKGSFTKCASCGSNMVFSPKTQTLFCEHCKSTKDFEKQKNTDKHPLDERPKDNAAYQDWKKQNKILRCQTCGAEIILNSLEYSGKCPYCDSSFVSDINELPTFIPDSIIPFKFDEETASQFFKKAVQKKFLVPNAFKKQAKPEIIKGIYVPSFAFDANSETKYVGKLSRVSHNGQNTTTYSFLISGTKKLAHTDFFVETSSKITQDEFRKILPYDMSESYKFSQEFILGYAVEHYQDAFEVSLKQAHDEMLKKIRQEILSGYSYNHVDYLNMNAKFSEEKYAYRLVPVYKLNFKYKEKNYSAQINGQTGKVGGKFPKSKVKIFFVILLSIILIGGIVLLSLL